MIICALVVSFILIYTPFESWASTPHYLGVLIIYSSTLQIGGLIQVCIYDLIHETQSNFSSVSYLAFRSLLLLYLALETC